MNGPKEVDGLYSIKKEYIKKIGNIKQRRVIAY